MKSKVKVLIPLVAALAMLTSCKGDNPSTSGGGGSSSPAISIDPTAYEGYYAPYVDLLSVEGNQLQFNLHKLCLITHTKIVTYKQFYNYTSASAQPRSIDQSPTDSSKNVFFYTGAENAKNASYTREHVWPCANSSGLWVHNNAKYDEYYVDGTGYWGGGSDLYHVRPATTSVNTARGNSKFKEFKEGETYYEVGDTNGKYILKVDKLPSGGLPQANKSEPADELKGDIVRICMYVYIHYSKIGDASWNWYYDEAKTKCVMGSLSLRDVFAGDTLEDVYDTMVRWNELDPVDDLERLRNDTIQKIQGNRNPFVDYPELIAKCFGL